MNVSKSSAGMGWAKFSRCKTEVLGVRRAGCWRQGTQRPVGGCVSPLSAPSSPAKQSLAPKRAACSHQHPLCVSFSPDDPGILSVLRNKYSHAHVYMGTTVLESRRCFILLTSFKYFHSMDFDSHCSWFCEGLDLALSETISRSLRNLKYNFSKFAYGCWHLCERINVQHVLNTKTHLLVDLPKTRGKDLGLCPLFAMVQWSDKGIKACILLVPTANLFLTQFILVHK